MTTHYQLEQGKRGTTLRVFYSPERRDWWQCVEEAVAQSGIDRRTVTVIAVPAGSTWSRE